MKSKAEIRHLKLAEREALTDEQRRDYSLAIAEHLWAMPEYIMSRALHVYLPIRNEVDTQPIIERAWREGRTVFVPVVVEGSSQLFHRVYEPETPLRRGAYGTVEPAGDAVLTTDELAGQSLLVLVPVVAFTTELYRLGYGKGYYDRFLSAIAAPRFGLAYSLQHTDEFAPEPHDQPLDAVITELGVARRWYGVRRW